MDERLVEHWLTSVNELAYQLPFCEVLLAEGYEVLYVSAHGRGEHGKDVVARRADGVLCSFQLKGGDVRLGEWRDIRGEVEELVQLPVRVPGVDEAESHVPHLVTNGEVRGDAVESIQRYVDAWVDKGHPRLEVWQRHTLVKKFVDAQGRYLPNRLVDFRAFVELYVGSFLDPLPREQFARLLGALVAADQIGDTDLKRARALAAVAVVAGYVLEQYERAENHVAALEGWTVVAATVLHVAERDALSEARYRPTLGLVWLALWRNFARFEREVLASESFFTSSSSLADGVVYGARVLMTLGWLGAAQLLRVRFPEQVARASAGPAADTRAVVHIVEREWPGARITGEVDWPYLTALGLYMEHVRHAGEAEALFGLWVRAVLAANRGAQPPGIAPPYWLHERVLRRRHGMLPPSEDERFADHTYTVMSALDMLVRRMRRRLVASFWPAVTHLNACDFVPDAAADAFVWQTRTGELRSGHPGPEASWAAWRAAAGEVAASAVPATLVRHPEWLLPFLLTYPHRANRALSTYTDAVIGRRARVVP